MRTAWSCWCGSTMARKFSLRSPTRCRSRRWPGMARVRCSPGVPRTARPARSVLPDRCFLMLEIFDRAFVLLGLLAGCERPEIATQAGLRVLLAGIEPVLSGFEFADHLGLHRTAS